MLCILIYSDDDGNDLIMIHAEAYIVQTIYIIIYNDL